MSYNYIDLFCGAGGMSKGFEQAGFQNVFSIEIDPVYAKTYKNNFPNHKVIVEDVKDVTNEQVRNLIGNRTIDVIVGGPPCQGFSIAGKIGRTFAEDERNYLFKEFVRFVKVISPKVFVMENVARMATHLNGKTIKEIVKTFEEAGMGYRVSWRILNAAEYHVPQERRRIFIVGVRKDLQGDFQFPLPEDVRISVREAIGDLPELHSGECSDIPNHNAMNHTEQMLRKMSFVPDGGDRTSIPEEIRPKSGDVRKYIRYASGKPSVCVTGDMRKIFHYSQNRALTGRELARLQSFDDDFVFWGSSLQIQQQIGNAVPPQLAKRVAGCVAKTLDDICEESPAYETMSLFKLEPSVKKKQVKKYPKVNYIGNKEKIIDWIIGNVPVSSGRVLDVFSGGSSVSYALKKAGYQVLANDVLYSNYVIAKALIENQGEQLKPEILYRDVKQDAVDKVRARIDFLANRLYFPYEVDELAELICIADDLQGYDKYIFLSLLRRAMIRKLPYSRMNVPWDQIQLLRDEDYSYRKYKRRRAYHNKSFRYHMQANIAAYNDSVFQGADCQVYQKDVFSLLQDIEHVDVAYIDPPYPSTMNDYDKFYGLYDIMFDKKLKHVDFISKNTFLDNLEELVIELKHKADYIMLSQNTRIKPTPEELKNMLSRYGKLEVLSKEHNYQVTGKENKNASKELLFVLKFA